MKENEQIRYSANINIRLLAAKLKKFYVISEKVYIDNSEISWSKTRRIFHKLRKKAKIKSENVWLRLMQKCRLIDFLLLETNWFIKCNHKESWYFEMTDIFIGILVGSSEIFSIKRIW